MASAELKHLQKRSISKVRKWLRPLWVFTPKEAKLRLGAQKLEFALPHHLLSGGCAKVSKVPFENLGWQASMP